MESPDALRSSQDREKERERNWGELGKISLQWQLVFGSTTTSPSTFQESKDWEHSPTVETNCGQFKKMFHNIKVLRHVARLKLLLKIYQ